MTEVSKNSRTSLPTTTSEKNYFYLTNVDGHLYQDYIYICLEDNNFGLSYNNIKYCCTNTYQYSPIDIAVLSCSFINSNYYDKESTSSTNKYYYKIKTSYLTQYTIVNYYGNSSSGYLYVTYDYKRLGVKITKVSKNSRTSLPTTTKGKNYFYLENSNYYSYIYICLEDNNFGLSYNNIKFCRTNTNPYSSPGMAVSGCSFINSNYYDKESSSSTNKYYYKISTNSSYSFTIVNYEGRHSSGRLYVTSNHINLDFKITQVYKNSSTSLPTSTSKAKYFYLTNSDYHYSHIYICLEDNNFGLSYNNIKYCLTDTINPFSFCSFRYPFLYINTSSSVQLNIITKFLFLPLIDIHL